jgi:uncharacterized protein (TIGR03663 family)
LANLPSKTYWAIFFGIALLALAFRLPHLAERPMHTDEAINAYITGDLLAGKEYQFDPRDRHGPVLYAVALPVAKLAGATNLASLTETSVRVGPVLVGALTVLLFGFLANQIGVASAIGAALLFAVSPLTVYYSRDFIHETFFVAATLGSIVAGGRVLQKPSIANGIVLGIGLGLMLACKETAALHFAAFGIATLWWFGPTMFRDRQSIDWRSVAKIGFAALISFCFVVVAFYSWGGRHWRGLLDLVHAVSYSASRATGEGHEKPVWYYIKLLASGWSGLGVLALALLAGVMWSNFWGAQPPRLPFGALRAEQKKREKVMDGQSISSARVSREGATHSARGGRAPHFQLHDSDFGVIQQISSGRKFQALVVYTIVIGCLYSAIPYKTPWLALNLWLPIVLLAGCGFVEFWRMARNRAGRIFVMLFAVALTAGLCRDTWKRVYVAPADEKNPYAYSQTGEDIFRLSERVQQLAVSRSPDGLRIAVVAADAWPLPWYLRKFPNTGFWQPGQEPGSADIYITSAEAGEKLAPRLKNWRPEFFGVRPEVLILLWTPPTGDPVQHE